MIELDIVERLRGKVRVPVSDGAGLLDSKDFFERTFPTSKAALEAADEIQRLRDALVEAQNWHEMQDKALSKSGRGDVQYHYFRDQHRQQIKEITAAVTNGDDR